MRDWDDRLTGVLRGESFASPPMWFMRQAGRYLPEYRAIRAKHPSFIEFCLHPEDAAEVTLQPIRRFDVDAAILFADILLIPYALGQGVRFEKGEGPKLEPVLSGDLLARLDPFKTTEVLAPIFDTVDRVRSALPQDKALIGFAGAPWTVATYMINGQGTKDPSAARALCYSDPQMIEGLLKVLVEATAIYLIAQAKAGANVLKLFDSWSSGLPERLFRKLCLEPNKEIARRVRAEVDVPLLYFPKGAGALYEVVAQEGGFDGLALDTEMPTAWARANLAPHGALQGGLDPLLVVHGGAPMREAAQELVEAYRGTPYIFNCGHGFVPETPPEHVADLVSTVRDA
ncbi:MAG: uroporphyrinogen decarboxylase [Pseudomonadota bacterium]